LSAHRFPSSSVPQHQEPHAGPEIEFNLAEYVGKFRRHWKVVVALCLIALTVTLVRYSMTPKRYQAAARIQIERRSTNPLLGTMSPLLENWWNMEYYPTQYKLLESHQMAVEAARILRLNGGAVPAGGGSGRGDGGTEVTGADDEAALNEKAASIRGGLQVVPIRGTQLVDLAYRASSGQDARDLANAYADAYVQYNYQTRTATTDTAGEFLSNQIENLKEEIRSKQGELQELSRSTDIVALDPETNVTLQRLETLNTQYMAAKNERIERRSRYEALSSSPAEVAASAMAEGLISQLRSEILRKEAEYSTRLQTFKEDWPEMVELKNSIDQSKEELAKLITETAAKIRQDSYAAYQASLRQEQSLDAEINTIKATAIDEQMAGVQIANLRVEVQTRQEMLNQLLRRRSETALTSNLQGFDKGQNNVRVIDYATLPGAPYYPSLKRFLLMGLLTGLGLSFGAVFLIEYLDRTIKSTEEAERLLNLPTLTVIPDIEAGGKGKGYGYGYGYGYGSSGLRKKRNGKRKGEGGDEEEPKIELLPQLHPRLPVSEAYRSLRTALLLSTADELKVVAVTSAQTGEGKTATATNLAVVMAQLGRKVLLMDADLRKPRLHQVFQISNRFGLVNLLTASGTAEEVYHRSEVTNLFVLPSGPIPPNPAELLASERMREFLRHLRSSFDFVVVDTTPTLAVTDATLVGSLADGVLLCLRANKVTREDARDCRDRLLLSEVKILGTVLNRYRQGHGRYAERYRHYEVYASSTGEEREARTAEDSAA